MSEQKQKGEALAAANAYFFRLEESVDFPPTVREALAASKRNPLMEIVFADGYLEGQATERQAIVAWLRDQAEARRSARLRPVDRVEFLEHIATWIEERRGAS